MFAERSRRGTWSDPDGEGRCPRCKSWLKDPQIMVWVVRHRSDHQPIARIHLCVDCTREVLHAWHVDLEGMMFDADS